MHVVMVGSSFVVVAAAAAAANQAVLSCLGAVSKSNSIHSICTSLHTPFAVDAMSHVAASVNQWSHFSPTCVCVFQLWQHGRAVPQRYMHQLAESFLLPVTTKPLPTDVIHY